MTLALRFVLTGAVFVPIGMALGIFMGINQDFEHRHLHAHLNLVGWVAMMLYGLTYRAFPKVAEGWLPRAHYWVALAGAVLFLPGIYLAHQMAFLPPVVIGSLLVLLSSLMFLVALIRGRAAD
jgi:cbb3-type cytochrome oxidase subunit 1